MADLPKLLQPWSIVLDEELMRLKILEAIAASYIRHLLRDPQTVGARIDTGETFTADELRALLR